MPQLSVLRIVIAEDQRLIRELLAGALSREEGFEIAGQADNGRDAVALVQSSHPDMLVLDVGLPDMDGVEVARALRKAYPELRILALSVHEEPQFVQRMLKAGADGYVVKSAATTELVDALRALRDGRSYLSPALRLSASGGATPLAPREREILVLIADGKRSAQIAERLSISVGTVEAHRRNIMAKLGLHNVAELTKYALREGLTSL
jgi:two-component system NarL family response regulator